MRRIVGATLAFVLLVGLSLISLSGLSGCKEKTPAWKQHAFTTQDMSRSAVESYLPRTLFSRITALLEPSRPGLKPPDELMNRKGPLPSVFTPIRVFLVEKNRGILTQGHTEIVYPAGGGELDLSQFVLTKKGSFYFAVDFLPDLPAEERHIYFLSHGKARTIDGEKYGAGCNVYFDITSSFNKSMSSEGFLVNTSDGRHVSALAGTFYFAAVREGKLLLASLTVKDSKQRKWQCERE